jgi:riboflavin kinase/FMN adenylyltransferase
MSYKVTEWERGAGGIGAAVIALGVFDGVHLGHQELVSTAIAEAARRDVESAVVTFDRDPDQVVTPDRAAPQLLTLEDKVRFLGETGTDHVVVLPFCMKTSKLPPETFVSDILGQAVEPQAIVVGEDFRFGQGASGDVSRLEHIAAEQGFDVLAHGLLEVDGAPVTSTRIRDLVAAGDVESAAALLGREHRLAGRVTHGRGEGADLVVPTANVVPVRFAAIPADGVYAGHVEVANSTVASAISVGAAPSFPDSRHLVEAHLIGFGGDLYHAELTVSFARRIRDLERFDDPDKLRSRVLRDVEITRETVG